MTDEELMEAAESIFDGWYADRTRIDWDDFLYRLECATDVDLGSNMMSPQIARIKAHVRAYRRMG